MLQPPRRSGARTVLLVMAATAGGCVDLEPPEAVRVCTAERTCANGADASTPGPVDAAADRAPIDGPASGTDPDRPAGNDVASETGTGPDDADAPDASVAVGLDAADDLPPDLPAPDLAPPPPKLGNGIACQKSEDCLSGFCVDGVCCQTACTEACKVCNLPSSMGACLPAARGTDPRNSCTREEPATCGRDGECDGAGGCQRWAAGTMCAAGTCVAATETSARTCDGMGTCRAATTKPCDPYVCEGAACATACSSNTQCQSTSFCDQAVKTCAGLKPVGAACAAPGECGSGFCVDGVCCQTACMGLCQACNVMSSLGTCTPIAAGQDPANECDAQAEATCGRDGTCNGNGACRVHVAGTSCAAASCTGGSLSSARTCDGAGTCQTASSTSCAPYLCAGAACATSCASDTDCASGHVCEGQQCVPKRQNGVVCTRPAQCTSSFCVDGVCCDGACTGTCQACNVAGSIGACRAVPAGQDPRDVCSPEAASTCGRDGTCNGAGACRLHASGTGCGAAASCTTGVETTGGTCNGQGTCQAGTMRACAPYGCAGSACATSCTTHTGCDPGYACAGGQCQSLATGLVGHWKLDESTTGGAAADSSGFGGHGSYTNPAPTVSSMCAPVRFANPYCLAFSSSYVIIPQSSRTTWLKSASFTISAWTYVAALPGQWSAVVSNEPAAPRYCGIWITPTNRWSFEANQTASSVSTPASTGWHHVAIVQDAGSNVRRIYVDGVAAAGTAAAEDCDSTSAWHVGATDVGDYWNGRIDDLRMYGRALSAAEIAALAAGQ